MCFSALSAHAFASLAFTTSQPAVLHSSVQTCFASFAVVQHSFLLESLQSGFGASCAKTDVDSNNTKVTIAKVFFIVVAFIVSPFYEFNFLIINYSISIN
jgi:hypothetical protein